MRIMHSIPSYAEVVYNYLYIDSLIGIEKNYYQGIVLNCFTASVVLQQTCFQHLQNIDVNALVLCAFNLL